MLEDVKIPIRVKLAGLWTSVMFLYIYGDYFALYKPGVLQSMLAGKMGPLGPVTQGVMLIPALMMVVPSLMIVLSLILKAPINRWLNIIVGILYSLIIVVTAWGDWRFVEIYGIIEFALTMSLAWLAVKWPKSV